jgi:hypothetical protein
LQPLWPPRNYSTIGVRGHGCGNTLTYLNTDQASTVSRCLSIADGVHVISVEGYVAVCQWLETDPPRSASSRPCLGILMEGPVRRHNGGSGMTTTTCTTTPPSSECNVALLPARNGGWRIRKLGCWKVFHLQPRWGMLRWWSTQRAVQMHWEADVGVYTCFCNSPLGSPQPSLYDLQALPVRDSLPFPQFQPPQRSESVPWKR